MARTVAQATASTQKDLFAPVRGPCVFAKAVVKQFRLAHASDIGDCGVAQWGPHRVQAQLLLQGYLARRKAETAMQGEASLLMIVLYCAHDCAHDWPCCRRSPAFDPRRRRIWCSRRRMFPRTPDPLVETLVAMEEGRLERAHGNAAGERWRLQYLELAGALAKEQALHEKIESLVWKMEYWLRCREADLTRANSKHIKAQQHFMALQNDKNANPCILVKERSRRGTASMPSKRR